MMTLLQQDRQRYNSYRRMPKFQIFWRLYQQCSNPILRIIFKSLFVWTRNKRFVELPANCKIGGGLYIGHCYVITINPHVVMGTNCNLHRGVTIGQTNRGKNQGVPVIGSDVWIGINATLVGGISIGDDVLIAPNSYVNIDVPSHSMVFGNPAVIRHKDDATKKYVTNRYQEK